MSISLNRAAFGIGEPAVGPVGAIRLQRPVAGPEIDTRQHALKIELIRGHEAFIALRTAWKELHDRASAPHQMLQSYEWLWHWHRNAHAGCRECPVLLTGRRGGRLVMVWPLILQRKLGIRVLGWMATEVSPYGDVLVEPGPQAEDDIRAGWDHLCRHAGADAIDLGNIRADAAIGGLIRALDLKPVREEIACSLDLKGAGSWQSFEASQSAKARKNRRRQRRRLEEMGQVRFEVVSEGERARALMRQALAMKRDWLRRKGIVSTAFACEWFDAFSADVASFTARPSGCRIGALTLDGQAVAITVGFVSKGHLSLHIVAHDPSVEACAPGSLLFEDMLRYAFDQGYTVFDLMWPGNAYKSEFAPEQTMVRNYSVAVTPLGQLHAAIAPRVRAQLKATYYAMPRPARMLVTKVLGRTPGNGGVCDADVKAIANRATPRTGAKEASISAS